MWFQKSRKKWVEDGDRNIAFYYRSTIIRRNRGRIRQLKINGEWVSDARVLKDRISNFFMNLFDRSGVDLEKANITTGSRGIRLSHS